MFADADVACLCLNCEARFNVSSAVKNTVYGYRINPRGIDAIDTGVIKESGNQLYDPDYPIYNRAALMDHLQQQFNNSARYGAEFTVMQLHLDIAEDQAVEGGAEALNRWLREVILRIRDSMRGADIIGMLAPDQLALLMPGTGEAAIEPVCNKLKQALSQSNREQYIPRLVEIRLHPTVYSKVMKHADQMLEKSDAAARVFEV